MAILPGDVHGGWAATSFTQLIHEDGGLLAECDQVDLSEVLMTMPPAQFATVRRRAKGAAKTIGGRSFPVKLPIFLLCLGGVLTVVWSMAVAGAIGLAVQRIFF
jgi:hypothetical protein